LAQVNPLTREVLVKLVYYGPGLCGKTTSLQKIHACSPPETRGQIVSLATPVDRTLYFDFLPLRAQSVRGHHLRLQLFTVPGQVYFNATRKLVLTGADGIIFVADSQRDRMDANLESLENLASNLEDHQRSLANVPLVLQYNKRDLPTAVSIEEMDAALNALGVPVVATNAAKSEGVLESLDVLVRLVLDDLERRNVLGSIRPPAPEAPRFHRAEPGFNAQVELASQELKLPDDPPSQPSRPPFAAPNFGPFAGANVSPVATASASSATPSKTTSGGSSAKSSNGNGGTGGNGGGHGALHPLASEHTPMVAPESPRRHSDRAPLLSPPPPPPPPKVMASAAALLNDEPTSESDILRPTVAPPAPLPFDRDPPRSLSFVSLFPDDEEDAIALEQAIVEGDFARVVEHSGALARRLLRQAGAEAEVPDAALFPPLLAPLVGIEGPRYAAFERVVRRAESGGTIDNRDALIAYSFVLEIRLRCDRSL
jgi:signal recognition particle receptor subunit beta